MRTDGRGRWRRALAYFGAVGAVVFATAATLGARGFMGTSVSILFFPAVLLTAIYGGYGPALLATILSTISLAYFLVTPFHSFDLGADDMMRLGAFAVIAVVTAWISSARKRAEDAQRVALEEVQAANATLRKVSGWPVFVDAAIGGAAARLLAHAASVVQCERALAIWEADDEPWVYLATSAGTKGGIVRFSPAELPSAGWERTPVPPQVAHELAGEPVLSAPFEIEHVRGRLFCSGVEEDDRDLDPVVRLVAHEVGNSLERLLIQDRLQQLAVREERIRVARDLHDGVLQSLTGIRLRLKALADAPDEPSDARDNLIAVERAIAIEQRELRLFIDDLKPIARSAKESRSVGQVLEDLRDRLALEWNTPIALHVNDDASPLAAGSEQTLRLLVREAIVNAMKHAQPSRVLVEVEAAGADRLRIVVSNDGHGFPFRGRMTHDQLTAANAGPVSLRERLVSIGGSLAIDSTAAGSRVEMVVPV